VIPVEQDDHRHCWEACLASILEVPLNDVLLRPEEEFVLTRRSNPWPLEEQPEWMMVNVRAWVEKRFGLSFFHLPLWKPFRLSDRRSHDDYGPWVPNGYWIGCVSTDEPNVLHALVMHRRTIAWDPHGTDDPAEMEFGPDPEFRAMTLFLYLDPAHGA
jgi:hypothetical protein